MEGARGEAQTLPGTESTVLPTFGYLQQDRIRAGFRRPRQKYPSSKSNFCTFDAGGLPSQGAFSFFLNPLKYKALYHRDKDLLMMNPAS
jgi:hypothetical protein